MKLSLKVVLLLSPVVQLCCKPSESIDVQELPTSEPQEMTLNDDGKEIQLELGEEFRVSLPENRSTGYKWELDAGELLHVKSDVYIADASQVGAGGEREYVLIAESVGEMTLEAVYIRPWETGMKPTQRFDVNVLIEP
ncbi:protease inhibitor I42 family protein [Rubritalea sp.]|uniref:protease inhibitor I42 family protein n=1 Tax=Rubritalea sp. TaxID=2109375 RepID=UPI003EF2F375